jgi:hypothetical protein
MHALRWHARRVSISSTLQKLPSLINTSGQRTAAAVPGSPSPLILMTLAVLAQAYGRRGPRTAQAKTLATSALRVRSAILMKRY